MDIPFNLTNNKMEMLKLLGEREREREILEDVEGGGLVQFTTYTVKQSKYQYHSREQNSIKVCQKFQGK